MKPSLQLCQQVQIACLFRKYPLVHANESVEQILEKQIILQDER